MATIMDLNTSVAEIAAAQTETAATLATLDAKLDEIRAFIQALQVGSPVTQQQLDDLFAAIEAAKVTTLANKDAVAAALAETDALDA